MADLSGSYNYIQNSLQAITREGFVTKKVIDTQFVQIKLLQFLRQKNNYDDVKGSLGLTWTVNTGRSPNTQTFDGDDLLSIKTLTGNLSRASVGWKRYTDALSLPLTDIIDNNGSPEAIANLLDVQLDITRMSIIDKIASDLVVNTSAIDPKGLDGLAASVDDGTVAPTYAGFSRPFFGPAWKASTNYAIPSGTSANYVANLHSLDLQASQDGQRPDLYATNTINFGTLIQSLMPQDNYSQPEMARTAGGNDFIFNGNPLFLDAKIPTGIPSPGTPPGTGTNSGGLLYLLNSTYLRLVVNPAANFSQLDWAIGQNNLILFTRLLWFANLVNLKPSSHAVAWIQGG